MDGDIRDERGDEPQFKIYRFGHFRWDASSGTAEIPREPLLMREVQQYTITNKEDPVRWDVAWMSADGTTHQIGLVLESDWVPWVGRLSELREKARAKFDELVPKGVRMLMLNLPRHALEAGYL